jgi:hypothetical protein
LIQKLVDESDGFIPFNKTDLATCSSSVNKSSTASNRVKEIRDNWDWYQLTGLLKGWHCSNYRKASGTKWSEVITHLDRAELKLKLQSLIQGDVEVRPLRE